MNQQPKKYHTRYYSIWCSLYQGNETFGSFKEKRPKRKTFTWVQLTLKIQLRYQQNICIHNKFIYRLIESKTFFHCLTLLQYQTLAGFVLLWEVSFCLQLIINLFSVFFMSFFVSLFWISPKDCKWDCEIPTYSALLAQHIANYISIYRSFHAHFLKTNSYLWAQKWREFSIEVFSSTL